MQKPPDTDHQCDAHDDNWQVLLLLIKLVVVGVLVMLGYLLVGEYVVQLVNKPRMTTDEIAAVRQRASARLAQQEELENWDRIKDGIHVRTGLAADENLPTIIAACTSCHSGKLIAQNKATREGWKSVIRWMQETQGLQDLGSSEVVILDYLAEHYAPKHTGRRQQIDAEAVEWYVLSLE